MPTSAFHRLVIGLAALRVVMASTAASAAAPACPPYRTPITLDFAMLAPDPILNNSLNIAGIRNLFASRGQALGGPHQRALGVTYIQSVLSLKASSSATRASGGYCVYLDTVGAEFGWRRMEVYVTSEYRPGSCEYRTVLDHENQHVAINRRTIKDYAPKARAALERILAEQKPIFARDPNGAVDDALRDLHQRMDSVLDQFQAAMAGANATIDTSANYDATAALCPGWNNGAANPPATREQR